MTIFPKCTPSSLTSSNCDPRSPEEIDGFISPLDLIPQITMLSLGAGELFTPGDLNSLLVSEDRNSFLFNPFHTLWLLLLSSPTTAKPEQVECCYRRQITTLVKVSLSPVHGCMSGSWWEGCSVFHPLHWSKQLRFCDRLCFNSGSVCVSFVGRSFQMSKCWIYRALQSCVSAEISGGLSGRKISFHSSGSPGKLQFS